MKPPFILSAESISHDTLRSTEILLNQIRKGDIIGVAWVAMCKRREYITNVAGEAYRNPTFTRGMVAALDDELRDMVHHQRQE